MAAWQFKFELIPLAWAKASDYQPDALYEEDFIRPEIAWAGTALAADPDDIFLQILPTGDSWHSDLTVWGDSDRNDISLWREADQVKEISIRFDLRSPLNALPAHVIGAATVLECAMFVPEQRALFNPDLRTLLGCIKASRAAQFVADPGNFLDRLRDE